MDQIYAEFIIREKLNEMNIHTSLLHFNFMLISVNTSSHWIFIFVTQKFILKKKS